LGLGILIAQGMPPPARINTALFVATALSITALPTLGRIMMELNLTRTRSSLLTPAFALPSAVWPH
jgi:Kef-type K+ transport system membrane component KefB